MGINDPIDRPSGLRGYNAPQGPLRIGGATRSLTGDVKTLPRGTTAMLVDVEYDTPRALFLSMRATAPVNGTVLTWRIRSGLDRASVASTDIAMNIVSDLGADAINRFVVARSLQVLVEYGATQPSPQIDCIAVVSPMEITVDVAELYRSGGALTPLSNGNTQPSRNGNPDSAVTGNMPQDAGVAQQIDNFFPVAPSPLVHIFGAGRRVGATVYNDSLSAAWLQLGGVAAANNFTTILQPGAYYETPYGYSGGVSLLWQAAGAGFARVTAIGYAGEL